MSSDKSSEWLWPIKIISKEELREMYPAKSASASERIEEIEKRVEAGYTGSVTEWMGNSSSDIHYLLSLLQEKEKRLKSAVEVITSIACVGKPEQDQIAYWTGFPNRELAEVLAKDTQIARTFLAEMSSAAPGDEMEKVEIL